MPFARVTPVIDRSVRGLCVKPYALHPKGCPNFAKKKGCPPSAPLLADAFDLDGPCYAIWNVFDFAAHVEKMRAAHPEWTQRQLANCLYWQGTARKALEDEIDAFIGAMAVETILDVFAFTSQPFEIERCPEAMGLNVTATMQSIGITLEWPPVHRAVQVAFAARKGVVR